MKKITSFLLMVAVLAMMSSFTAFAAADANAMTITTDVTSVATGEDVYVTVELTGDIAEVAMVQLAVKYDNTKFSTVTTGRAPWGFDSTWYNSTKDGNTENLGYINTPSFGENPAGQINVMFISTDGYYIDDAGALYGDDMTTTAAKIKFTALTDVETIDATCFELVDASCLVTETSGSSHTVTVNQIAAPVTDNTVYSAAVECAKTWTAVKNADTSNTNTYENVAVATATCPATATEAGFKFAKDSTTPSETAAKFAVPFDAEAVNGPGTVEYTAVMYNVDYTAVTTVYAIPYYVPAN